MGFLDFLITTPEDIHEIDIEDLQEDDYELKFFVWSRKIEDEVNWLEEHRGKEAVRIYLQKCADMREKFLDPADLTETEDYYMGKIQDIWREYDVIDPMYPRD